MEDGGTDTKRHEQSEARGVCSLRVAGWLCWVVWRVERLGGPKMDRTAGSARVEFSAPHWWMNIPGVFPKVRGVVVV